MAESSFGDKVRKLREERGWGQQQLAKIAGLSQPAISRIERGLVQQPRLSVIKRLSQALGVTTDFLLQAHDGASLTGDAPFLVAEVRRTYDTLDHNGRRQLLNYVRFLAQEVRGHNGKRTRK